MNKRHFRPSFTLRILALCLLAAATRILPHPVNFGPLTAVALFAGYRLGSIKLVVPVVLLTVFLSDVLVNALLYHVYDAQYFLSPITLSLYTFYVAASLLSTRLSLQKVPILMGSSLAASVTFFLVSNAAVWASGTTYPGDLAGLMACYIAGLPFFSYTVAGDLFYLSALVLGTAWAERHIPAFQSREL